MQKALGKLKQQGKTWEETALPKHLFKCLVLIFFKNENSQGAEGTNIPRTALPSPALLLHACWEGPAGQGAAQ